MKEKILLLSIIVITGCLAYGQELFDPIYDDIDIWLAKGYCSTTYNIRPYSPELLIALLDEVLQKGDENAKVKAQLYLGKLQRGGLNFEAFTSQLVLAGAANDYRGVTGIAGRLLVHPGLHFWGKVHAGGFIVDGQSRFYPYGEGERIDIHEDYSMYFFPPFISGDNAAFLLTLTSYVWYGDKNLWFSAGLGRTSAGPFFDNGIFIGHQARQTANWSINFVAGQLTFSIILMQLTPVNGVSNKYAVYHDYSYAFNEQFSIGLVETVIWGGEFKPQYLVPITAFFYQQSMTGGGLYADNSLAGGYIVWKNLQGLAIRGAAFLDDVGPNEYVKFNFDTKTIAAVQLGVFWAPEFGIVKKISGDYTAVFPYMYTHHFNDREDNYTHMGMSLGAALLPNSDRFEVSLVWDILNLSTMFRLMRHANASEGVYTGTGDYWDDGWVNGEPTYQQPYPSPTSPQYFRFLSQNVIETIWQITIETARLELFHNFFIDIGYSFEYHTNYNLEKGVSAVLHYFSLNCRYVF